MVRRSSKRNPCFPPKGKEKDGLKYLNSKACIKAQIRDNPWMLEKGGTKLIGKGPLLDEIMRIKKKKKTKKNKKKYKQKGGALCLPCLPSILTGLGSALGVGAAGVGAATVAKSFSSKSSHEYINGKVKRKEEFNIINKKNKTKKKKKYSISQNNLEVIIKEGKKKIKKKFKTLKKANKYFEKELKKYKKCQ